MSAITKNDKIVTADMLQDYHDEHVAPFLGGNVLGAQSNFKNSDIYSTTERIVGCWTDGRPLYQVLVPISTGAINTWHEGVVSTAIISNPASVVFRTVQAYIESNGGVLYNINNEVGNNNGCGFYLGKASSSNQVCYGTYPNYADFANRTGYMIIQYTKTTDAAGSYYLAGENDYSTDEKIIGKWIDGKNIYRKCCSTTTGSTVKVMKEISYTTLGLPSSANIIKIPSIIVHDSDGYSTMVENPWYSKWWSNTSKNFYINVESNNQGYLNRPVDLIVEYTKTS